MVSNNHSINNREESDLKSFTQLIIRNYKLFAICIGVALVAAYISGKLMTPKYQVSSSLLITEENRRSDGDKNEYLQSKLFTSNQNLQNELWLLKSMPTINQAIRNLNLSVSYFEKKGWGQKDIYGNNPFEVKLLKNHIQPINVRFDITYIDDKSFFIEAKGRGVSFVNFKTGETEFVKNKWHFRRKGRFGNLIEYRELGFVIDLNPDLIKDLKDNNNYSFLLSDYLTLGNELKKNLEFRIVDKLATVIEISLKSYSVKKGKDILNEIMNVYSMQNLARKNHTASVTIKYIEKQLDEISDSLSLTEESLQRFRSVNYILNVNQQNQNISSQYLDLQNQLAEIMTRKRYYDYVAEYLENNDDFSSMTVPASMGIPDQLLNNLMSELITSQTERSNLVRNNQEYNPLVQKLTVKIENIKETILKNITAVRNTVDISIDEMNKRIQKLQYSISRMPQTQLELGGLERKYKLNDAIYNYLLEKRAEAKITLASNIPNSIIISPARMAGHRPVSPNNQLNYTIALLLGLAFPFGYLILKNVFNNKIDAQDDIFSLTNVPTYGKIMHNKRHSPDDLYELPNTMVQESFRALRTNLEFQFMDILPKVILVTSSIEGEGKSFISSNLAYSYAQLGFKTVLINFDLRKKSEYFSIKENDIKGIYSWYTEMADLDSIAHKSPYENLDYIQSGDISSDPAKIMSNKNTTELITQLKSKYNCIILDTSPLAQVSDAYLLMDYSDIKIVVARYNYSVKRVISLIMKDLLQKKIKNVGVVMNDNSIYSNQYGYGYGYSKQNGNGSSKDVKKKSKLKRKLIDNELQSIQ